MSDHPSSPRYCSGCGTPVVSGTRFCGECGTPLAGAVGGGASDPATTATADPVTEPPGPGPARWAGASAPASPVPAASPSAAVGPRRRRFRPLVAALVLVLVAALVAGALVLRAVLVGGGPGAVSTSSYGTTPLRSAPTSEPTRAWTFRPPSGQGLFAIGGPGSSTIVSWFDSTEEEEASSTVLGRLDDDGELAWEQQVDDGCEPVGVAGDVVVCQAYAEGETGTIRGFSASDGEEVWTVEGGYVRDVTGDRVLVSDDASVRRIDTGDGSEEWSVSADGLWTSSDVVYVVADGRLSRLDPDSGQVAWEVGTLRSDDVQSLVGGGDHVAVGSEDEVRLYDAGDGGEVTRVDLGDVSGILPVSDGFAVMTTVYGGEEDSEADSTITTVGRDGVVDEIGIGSASPPDTVVGSGADLRLVSGNGGGPVYDESLTTVATLPDVSEDGFVGPARNGYYLTQESRTRFLDLEGDTRWTLEHDGTARVVDGALLVTSAGGDVVERYG